MTVAFLQLLLQQKLLIIEIINHKSPALCEFDVNQMRPHLIKCLEAGFLSRFPLKKVRRVPMGRRVQKSIAEKYCIVLAICLMTKNGNDLL